MKKVLIAALLILSVVAVNAKEKEVKHSDTKAEATTIFSGTIADDKSGESLVGVEVKLEGTDLKTYTDFDGNFTFKNVKPGAYKLTSSYISYEKKTKSFNVSPNTKKINIKLHSSN